MTKTKSCTIRLLDKSYDIKCPEKEADNLKLAALKLHNHMLEKKNKFKQLEENQLLLLAALQVSHELILTEAQQEARQEQLAQFIHSIEEKINQTTSQQAPNKPAETES